MNGSRIIGVMLVLCGAYFACDVIYMHFARHAGWDWLGSSKGLAMLALGAIVCLRRRGPGNGSGSRGSRA